MIADVLADATERMNKAVEVTKDDFSSVRTGRANPALFQKILVSYYGTPTPLEQLASLQNQEARTLLVTPYDKSALRDIEQAIRDVAEPGCPAQQRRHHHPSDPPRPHGGASQGVREDRAHEG